jgi:hypothetical protein
MEKNAVNWRKYVDIRLKKNHKGMFNQGKKIQEDLKTDGKTIQLLNLWTVFKVPNSCAGIRIKNCHNYEFLQKIQGLEANRVNQKINLEQTCPCALTSTTFLII